MNNQEFEKLYGTSLSRSCRSFDNPWTEYKEEVFKEGLISVKDKQLIAVSCAHITGCEHCIRERTKLAKAEGATDEEIAESVYIAIRLAMGQPYAFSSIALENYDLMKAKENVTKGYFISKNITPQIMDFHDVSGEKHKKFSAFHEIVYEDGHLSKKTEKGAHGSS